ncbi:hypothetical protein DMUE_3416 [Dictyocoela muelleri]|nr:hypothetical protein DMUE_3416 [Dictyocoela muelleri]
MRTLNFEDEALLENIHLEFKNLMDTSESLRSDDTYLRYLFSRKYSEFYHYYKHVEFEGKNISHREYIEKVNFLIDYIFNIFSFTGDYSVFMNPPLGFRRSDLGIIIIVQEKEMMF